MRRTQVVGVLVAIVGVVAGSPERSALAQELALAGRTPRFLYAASISAAPVEIDANRHAALRRVVSLRLDDPTVGRLLTAIEQQTGIKFAYNDDFPLDRPITLRAEAITVATALSGILLDTGLDVLLSRGNSAALVKSKSRQVQAQLGVVVGRVTDAKTDIGIGGVDISFDGTRWRTATDANGRYRLANVTPGSYTVLARRIGYGPQRRAVTVTGGQEATVDVALQPAAARLGDLIVTAEKREERLQDVPIPVTAIRADQLVNSNQLRLQDYYTSIPGLNVIPAGFHNAPMLVIRGITTGSAFLEPTVGVTVDDVPYGASKGFNGGFQAPDLDPSDLAQIEVLRGPQGTLYGASSMGGLLKFQTVDPSTDRVSGRVQGSTSSVYNGAELGYNVRGAVNVPLSRTLAIRASGFTRRDAGYVDDPGLGVDGVNRTDVYGGRVSALWRPSDVFALRLSALLQDASGDGSSYVVPGLGELQHSELPGAGVHSTRVEAYSARLTGKLGSLDLTAISGYSVENIAAINDYSEPLRALTQASFPVAGGTSLFNADGNEKFTQELRLSIPLGQRLEWRVGGFYTHEEYSHVQRILAVNSTTGATVGEVLDTRGPGTYTEYAAFTDLTFHVTDRFDVQVGGRQSRFWSTGGPGTLSGALVGSPPAPIVAPKMEIEAQSPFTYLLTPRFKVSSDLMVYARLASGYRAGAGGVAAPAPTAVCVVNNFPCQFGPDKTQNYEVGIKGDVLDHALSFDASLYYIDWTNIQLLLRDDSGFGYIDNAGGAKSQGVELSLEAGPVTGLRIAAWGAWSDAKLTEDFASGGAFASAGDRLPQSPRFSGKLSLDQEVLFTNSVTGFVGGSVSYVGERTGLFTPVAAPQRQIYRAYTRADLLAGVRYASWLVNVFVNNVTDERAPLSGGLGSSRSSAFTYVQPRTAGVSLSKTF